ncbi:MAG: dihydroorotate dehydrogenase electron transfer subunit [Candidatus Dormibacterales bacterium]
MFLLDTPIVGRRSVGNGMFAIAFQAPQIASSVRAGQFVNLGWSPGPLLRRPFSVYRTDGDRIEIVLKSSGVGTAQLLAMSSGEVVSCLGPLGRGFNLESGPRTVALVSGGVGVAPMPLAAKEAAALGMRVTWVHGARSAPDLCSEWAGDEVIWATDDGSRGFHGTAVAASPDADVVLACGPNRMLSAVSERWPEALVAVETYMGCGTGVCLGCAVPMSRGGYDRACTEGPVFHAREIDWTALPSNLAYAVSG